MSDETPTWRDINRVELRGRLGRDPEMRSFSNGGQVASLSIATSEKWKDKNSGEMKEITEWHRVSVKFNDVAINTASNMVKGQRVRCVGKIVSRKFNDQSGNERTMYEIEVGRFGELEVVPDDRDDRPAPRAPATAPARAAGGGSRRAPDDSFDEIPF